MCVYVDLHKVVHLVSWSQQSEKWKKTDFFEKRGFCSEHQPKREDVMKADKNRLFFFSAAETRHSGCILPRPLSPWQLIKPQQGTIIPTRWIHSCRRRTAVLLSPVLLLPYLPSLLPYLVNQKAQCSFAFCKKSFKTLQQKKTTTTWNSFSQAEYMQGYKADIAVPNTLRVQMLIIHAPPERVLAGCHFWVARTSPNRRLIIIISRVIDSSVC